MQSNAQAMLALNLEDACDFLDAAAHREQPISAGHRAINFGIDSEGRNFILIHDALEGARLAYL